MKIIVTHFSPDWDAITSVWLLKRFLPGWEKAEVKFVPAGQRLESRITNHESRERVIEQVGGDEVIHTDTGMGPLDHHQIQDGNVCAASLCWDFVQKAHDSEFLDEDSEKIREKREAVDRIIRIIVAIDHFQEVFWENPTADYHEFSLIGVLEGVKMLHPGEDQLYIDFGMECLDAELHNFENRIWAEKEIDEKANIFDTRFGKAIAIESINDSTMKLAQKMGYVLTIRKDPRKGYVRIKARPEENHESRITNHGLKKIDLTLVYEKLKKMDPDATWYLHISKKMLLNGTPKNPNMIATKLTLKEIIQVVRNI